MPTGPPPHSPPGSSAGPAAPGRHVLPALADLWDALWSFAAITLGLGVAIALVEDITATDPWAVPAAATIASLLSWILAAPLRWLADRLGGGVAFVLGLAVQVGVLWMSLVWMPGIVAEGPWATVWVIMIAGAALAATAWLLGQSDSSYVVSGVVRRGRRLGRERRHAARQGRPLPDDRPPGLLLVVIDGVSEPVLRLAIEAGMAPTMARWLDAGTHRLEHWWAQVPSTTPASFAGLLHGTADHIPAFRWWDPELGRLVVANHPWDAATIEAEMSDGEGLLAYDGAAVGMMFSGDAPATTLVMSRTVGHSVRGKRVGSAYVRFFTSPLVFSRALVLTVGEMVKEVYQARLARMRRVSPRISRGGWYILLRGVTNVTLRGLATSLVADHMSRGTPSIAVDFVDYDEIAHHAGPVRPESLRALEGLDGVLRTLETVNEVAARNYRIVVLSDHGQALGATFEQVAGMSLTELVTRLMGKDPHDVLAAGPGEEWGPVNALLNDLVGPIRGRTTVRGPDRHAARGANPANPANPANEPSAEAPTSATEASEHPEASDAVTVIASGNLSLVWFTGLPGRTRLDEIRERWPDLVPGLAAHPGLGVVVVDSARGLLAVGPRGVRELEPATLRNGSGSVHVEGTDPLAIFEDPEAAARDLARAARLRHTGDLLLVSAVHGPRVHAFEHQVGSHGGIGGEQNRAVFLSPTSLERTCEPDLVGADAVFRQLVEWQRRLGLRP